jgi:hypothetical protein
MRRKRKKMEMNIVFFLCKKNRYSREEEGERQLDKESG